MMRRPHVRRLLLGLAGLAVLLAVPAAAAAKPLSSPSPLRDTATATGGNPHVDQLSAADIEVNAFSGPSGEDPGGHASFVAGNGTIPISGPVNCLDVSGNTAVLTIAGPFPSVPGITAFVIKLVDRGGGLDSFEYWIDDDEIPEVIDCHEYSGDYFGGPLIGRAIVNDVDPLTSKMQCRRGGFAGFGFKNQGQCIRYLKHH